MKQQIYIVENLADGHRLVVAASSEEEARQIASQDGSFLSDWRIIHTITLPSYFQNEPFYQQIYLQRRHG